MDDRSPMKIQHQIKHTSDNKQTKIYCKNKKKDRLFLLLCILYLFAPCIRVSLYHLYNRSIVTAKRKKKGTPTKVANKYRRKKEQ